MALHRSSKFNAADGLFETARPEALAKEKEKVVAKKAKKPEIGGMAEEPEKLNQETTDLSTEKTLKAEALTTDYSISISSSKQDLLKDDSSIPAKPAETATSEVSAPAKEQQSDNDETPHPAASEKTQKKLSATAIMPRKVPKKASESVINRTYTIDQGTYDLMSALVRFMRDSRVKDEETGYLINESAFIRRAIRTEMDRVFDSNDEAFSDSVRQYLDKPLRSSPSKITY